MGTVLNPTKCMLFLISMHVLSAHAISTSGNANFTEIGLTLNGTDSKRTVELLDVSPTLQEQQLNNVTTKSTETVVDVHPMSPGIILYQSYAFDMNRSDQFLITDVTDFVCSTSGLCDASLSRFDPLCTFDCSECKCDDMCNYYGDCCPDIVFHDSFQTSTLPFPHLACVEADWTTWANDSNVFMVSRCPDKALYTNKDTVSKCYHPDKYHRDQATPVSAIDSEITYRNIYCAMCHGVMSTKPWRHQVVCETEASVKGATSREELWKLVLNSSMCEVTSFPPLGVSTRRCVAVLIDSCNVTGKWTEQNADIERLCGLYTHQVNHKRSIFDLISYKNIFCAVCNGAILSTYAILCGDFSLSRMHTPARVLLEFNSDTRSARNNGVDKFLCWNGQTFDPFSGRCRSLSCTSRRVLVESVCYPVFASTKGLGFSFSAVIRSNNGTFNAEDDTILLQYLNELKIVLAPFEPFIFPRITLEVIGELMNAQVAPVPTGNVMISASAEVVSLSDRSLAEMERTLEEILTLTYLDRGNEIIMSSTSVPCSWEEDWMNDYVGLRGFELNTPASVFHSDCNIFDCLENVEFMPVDEILDCAFIEYNMTLASFNYDPKSSSLKYDNRTIYLNESRLFNCGETLRLCSDVVSYIHDELIKDETETENIVKGTSNNPAMASVSMICISYSLFGLSMRFLI